MIDKLYAMNISRKQKMVLSSSISLLNQLISFVTGFILPKLFLTYYGSAVNGLVSSITQFLGFIALCELGVGSVVQSALYSPLANNDRLKISQIVVSSERFFKKIAYILLVYTIGLMVFYPFLVHDQFGFVYTMLLIFVIAINSFSQYYFGMTYRLLLNADQLAFLQLGLNSILLIINAISCIVLMKNGVSIHFVKLLTSLLFLIQPILLSSYAKKRYDVDIKVTYENEPIKQKWNGLAQHIAAVVLENTDIVVLTALSTLENVSIYSVYHLVVNGLKKIINSITTGMQAMLGNMLAKKEMKVLEDTFNSFEWFMHTVVTFIFGATAFLILPFVTVYTRNITDANYSVPVFAILITSAQAVYSIRIPYNMMTLAAGHYKETQLSSIIEAIINITTSIFAVFKFGLIGVSIGTLLAMSYRTIYLVHYVSRCILPRKAAIFYKHLIVDFSAVGLFMILTKLYSTFFLLSEKTYISWLVLAVKVIIVLGFIILCVNMLFYRKYMVSIIKKNIEKILSFVRRKI